jgi:hypothetical protein
MEFADVTRIPAAFHGITDFHETICTGWNMESHSLLQNLQELFHRPIPVKLSIHLRFAETYL